MVSLKASIVIEPTPPPSTMKVLEAVPMSVESSLRLQSNNSKRLLTAPSLFAATEHRDIGGKSLALRELGREAELGQHCRPSGLFARQNPAIDAGLHHTHVLF